MGRELCRRNSDASVKSKLIVKITYPKPGAQRLDVGFIHFVNARKGSTEDRIIVLIHTLFDEIWRLVLELLECGNVLPGFFVAGGVSDLVF